MIYENSERLRRIDNQRGYINATTGQNLIVTKKQYGEHYIVLLFPRAENNDDEGRKISQVSDRIKSGIIFGSEFI
jgi:hypothetical protein